MVYRCLLFSLLCLSVNSHAFAENLTFTLIKKVYDPKEEIILEINSPCTNNLKMRPLIDNGRIEIYNGDIGKWVSSANTWENFPFVGERAKLRTSGVDDKKINIEIELQSTKIGKIVKTKPFNIWISDGLSTYTKIVNDSILSD